MGVVCQVVDYVWKPQVFHCTDWGHVLRSQVCIETRFLPRVSPPLPKPTFGPGAAVSHWLVRVSVLLYSQYQSILIHMEYRGSDQWYIVVIDGRW